jgi:hypothetical protein
MNIPARIAMNILHCFNGGVPRRKLHAQDADLKTLRKSFQLSVPLVRLTPVLHTVGRPPVSAAAAEDLQAAKPCV